MTLTSPPYLPRRPLKARAWEAVRLLALLAVICSGAPLSGCNEDIHPDRKWQKTDTDPSKEVHEVVVERPEGLGSQTAEGVDVPCAGCHTMHQEPPFARSAADLKDFHRELVVTHGDVTCFDCHARDNRDQLKLADGTTFPLEDSIQLCAQCHGVQYRDYKRGSHGGMTGHWDLQTGPRSRQHCLDCHLAHQPAYPSYQPVFPPADRFLESH